MFEYKRDNLWFSHRNGEIHTETNENNNQTKYSAPMLVIKNNELVIQQRIN